MERKNLSSLLPFRKQERKTLTQNVNCKLKDEKIFLLNLQRCPIPLSCMLLFHTHPEMILYQSKSEHHTAAVIQNDNTKIWISEENKGFTLLLINNKGVLFLKELVLHPLGIITQKFGIKYGLKMVKAPI